MCLPAVISSLFLISQSNFFSIYYTHCVHFLPCLLLNPWSSNFCPLLSIEASFKEITRTSKDIFHLFFVPSQAALDTVDDRLHTSLTSFVFQDLTMFFSYFSGHYSSVSFNAFSDCCSNVPALWSSALDPLLLPGYILSHLICSVSI